MVLSPDICKQKQQKGQAGTYSHQPAGAEQQLGRADEECPGSGHPDHSPVGTY